ncbi:alanine/glycine:cation symporter family protein [Woeseia oceani]|uniref:Sodium/alanine symporter n=1 Tax=Woeseia oceani TaxID=1548547 RepID=A0A193LFG0_9GAMM|nr:alanine/glycine:cation symporter family protein [Woeseia oceani]ANO51242.1 sodium/alanine symporter [Woeseia oceani]
MATIGAALNAFSSFMWGTPLVVLLVGGGIFFVLHSRGLPYRYFRHGFQIITGRYDNDSGDQGDISHFKALATALSGTLGLGNITGVAVAITVGGPGAVFWMWITAIIGIATKFYTASLAVMFRGRDDAGHLQGGPMYVIREGLGRRWMPLAWLFCIAALFGTLPIFQINQLVQIIRDVVAVPAGLTLADDHLAFDLLLGLIFSALVFAVIVGRIQRIANVTSRVVPFMVVFYFVLTAILLVQNASEIPGALSLIVSDAFSGQSVAGGAIGTVILIGVQRGAFSNEAGIGTESLAHGAARTNEPIREGLVAMIGPFVDTLIVCTCTALAILVTGAWQSDAVGVTMTSNAFETAFPGFGGLLLVVMVFFLSISTVLTFSYYGGKCAGFLFGTRYERWYIGFYTVLIIVGAAASLRAVIGLIDGMYATMAIPTMVSSLLLAPKVRVAAKDYFARLKASGG